MAKDETLNWSFQCVCEAPHIIGIVSSNLDELSGDKKNYSVMDSVTKLGLWLLTDSRWFIISKDWWDTMFLVNSIDFMLMGFYIMWWFSSLTVLPLTKMVLLCAIALDHNSGLVLYMPIIFLLFYPVLS